MMDKIELMKALAEALKAAGMALDYVSIRDQHNNSAKIVLEVRGRVAVAPGVER